jgi:hypothetical protein
MLSLIGGRPVPSINVPPVRTLGQGSRNNTVVGLLAVGREGENINYLYGPPSVITVGIAASGKIMGIKMFWGY